MEISIIIPTYQMEKYISRAIRSAVDQRYPKDLYEIIVIDDGSTDHTKKILNAFDDSITLISHDRNIGLAAARNSGLRQAKGRFVVNLDADDYFSSELIRIESLFLSANNDMDAVSCDYYTVDEHEFHIKRHSGEKDPIACGVMFRKEQLIELGLYDEGFIAREEEDLRIRFLQKYKIYNIPLPLYRYRKHDSNLTGKSEIMDKSFDKLKEKHNK